MSRHAVKRAGFSGDLANLLTFHSVYRPERTDMKVTNAGTVKPFEAIVMVKVTGEASETGHLSVMYEDINVVGGNVQDNAPAGALTFAFDAVERLIKRGAGL